MTAVDLLAATAWISEIKARHSTRFEALNRIESLSDQRRWIRLGTGHIRKEQGATIFTQSPKYQSFKGLVAGGQERVVEADHRSHLCVASCARTIKRACSSRFTKALNQTSRQKTRLFSIYAILLDRGEDSELHRNLPLTTCSRAFMLASYRLY